MSMAMRKIWPFLPPRVSQSIQRYWCAITDVSALLNDFTERTKPMVLRHQHLFYHFRSLALGQHQFHPWTKIYLTLLGMLLCVLLNSCPLLISDGMGMLVVILPALKMPKLVCCFCLCWYWWFICIPGYKGNGNLSSL